MESENLPIHDSIDRDFTVPPARLRRPLLKHIESGPANLELKREVAPISSQRAGFRHTSFSQRLPVRVRRSIRVLGIGVLVAASSMACLAAVSWVRSQAAVQVVRAQVEAIRVGKVEAAYALFSSGYQAGVSLPMFRRWLRRQGRLGKVQKLQFWGRSVWGETAVLWGSFQDDLGHSYPVRYLLIRERGSWRIDGFHLSAEIPDAYPNTVRFLHI